MQTDQPRVGVVINYDKFRISEDTYDDYADMDRHMLEHYYTTITRFATSAFMRMKLGEVFTRRNMLRTYSRRRRTRRPSSSRSTRKRGRRLRRPASCN